MAKFIPGIELLGAYVRLHHKKEIVMIIKKPTEEVISQMKELKLITEDDSVDKKSEKIILLLLKNLFEAGRLCQKISENANIAVWNYGNLIHCQNTD